MKIKFLILSIALMASAAVFAQTDVSDVQLAQFADAYIKVQEENVAAQQKMIAIIEDEGLNVERFSEIQEASMDPAQESNATPDEVKKHAKAIEKLNKLQPELEKNAINGIESTGISVEQYQSLASAIQNDQGLQQRLQIILMERMQ